jgi:hypothetical protein
MRSWNACIGQSLTSQSGSSRRIMSFEAFAAWGADAIERHAPSPADLAAPDADEHWVRAIDVAAPPALFWRWICQLRGAPYSYDWIDNLGKRSPQQLTPGLDQPAVGQTVLRIFRIASFARDEHLTVMLDSTSRPRPPYAMAYVITPKGPSASRLVVHIRASAPHGLPKRARRALLAMLAPVDLMMTRRQLRNLKALAERDARNRSSATA